MIDLVAAVGLWLAAWERGGVAHRVGLDGRRRVFSPRSMAGVAVVVILLLLLSSPSGTRAR
jgi:hypothetical protein